MMHQTDFTKDPKVLQTHHTHQKKVCHDKTSATNREITAVLSVKVNSLLWKAKCDIQKL